MKDIEKYISNLGADINQKKIQNIKIGKFSLLQIIQPVLILLI